MALLRCSYGHTWLGEESPFCPTCAIKKWEAETGFIKDKHDPTKLPLPMKGFRSVVTMDFITDKGLYIYTLATEGNYYYDTQHRNFSCVLSQPIGSTAGSAIPSWFPMPTYPMDSQIIADVWGTPHVFAEDMSTIAHQVSIGRLIPPRRCDTAGCPNFAIPGSTKCSRH